MLGLGFATLTPLRGGAAIVLAAAGARLAGVLVQALPSYHPLSSATITTSHYLPVPQSPPIYLWCARAGGAAALARTGAGGLALTLTLTRTLALASTLTLTLTLTLT